MTLRTTVLACAALLVSVAVPAAADQWNKRTLLTVSEPIQISGHRLEPGKYILKLAEGTPNRNIVQILRENDAPVATVLALPNYRIQPTGETKFGFYETPSGDPPALRAWFYPGDNFGQEFVYPKKHAMAIAKATGIMVPTSEARTMEAMKTAHVMGVDATGTELELDRATYTPPRAKR